MPRSIRLVFTESSLSELRTYQGGCYQARIDMSTLFFVGRELRWACTGSGAPLSAAASSASDVMTCHNLILTLPED
jgi:hypothetical protein